MYCKRRTLENNLSMICFGEAARRSRHTAPLRHLQTIGHDGYPNDNQCDRYKKRPIDLLFIAKE